jgi:UDP-perosamine 4-acetyltransferase
VEVLFLDGRNPEDYGAWDRLVDQAPIPDVYYRPGYAEAFASAEGSRPVALVIREGPSRVLIPLLIRDFELDGKPVRDAITPYGYGGLLLLAGPIEPGSQTAKAILSGLRQWAIDSGLVACTLRLHPLLEQDSIWTNRGTGEEWLRTFPRGLTTAIDLRKWEEDRGRVAGMDQLRRRNLKRARAALSVRISQGAASAEGLIDFCGLYRESMDRVHADSFFFFEDRYFDCLSRGLGDRFVLIMAYSEGRPVAGAIFLADRDFVHYHLAASNEEGKLTGAATLVIVSACEWGREHGCRWVHLGGGVHPDDQLWAFKRSFGGKISSYSFLTVVADPERYRLLTEQHEAVWPYSSRADQPVTIAASRPAVPSRPAIKVVGIGAGGHARVIMDILSELPWIQVVGLVEWVLPWIEKVAEEEKILGNEAMLPDLLERGVGTAFIGIGGVGDNGPRAKAFYRVLGLGFDIIGAIHPRAVVARTASLGRGVSIMAGAVVNPGAVIGDNVILNSNCTVEYGCVIGDHVHIAPGATLSGEVQVGQLSHIGTGASVRQGTRIGERAVIGAGSVVVSDVPDGALVVGAPARSVDASVRS